MSSEPGGWTALARRELRNGLVIELVVEGDPSVADVAVCPADERGTPGRLNSLVLEAVGIAPDDLPNLFHPPVTLLRGAKALTLVVQTVGGHQRSRDLLLSNLNAGLNPLESALAYAKRSAPLSMFLPLLATGAGGLSPVESVDAMIDVLAAWEHPTVQRVWLSAPSPEVAGVVADHWRKPSPSMLQLSVVPFDMEMHVAQALAAAQSLAAGEELTPSHVFRAIIGVPQLKSPAFDQLRRIADVPAVEELRIFWGKIASEGLRQPVKLAAELERQLTYAQQWRRIDEGRHRIWGRDLVTAVAFAAGPNDWIALTAAGHSREQLLEQWYHYVTKDGHGRSHAEWDAWWDFAGVPRPHDPPNAPASTPPPAPPLGPSRAGYFADTDQGKDCLGVEQEAEALARLILDENVEPPLSIGLLGDWGSGKSFFIEQLKKEVDECKGSPGLHRDVVQIEFNAWHVSDGNLWASLVTHIFEEIWKQAIPLGAHAETARAQLVAEMSKAEGAMHEAGAEVEKAQAAVNDAEKRRSKNLVALSVANVVGTELANDLKEKAKQAGWQRPLENLVEAQAAARVLANTGEKLRMQWNLVLGELPRGFAWLFAIAAATLGVCLGIDRLAQEPALKDLLQHATRLFGVAGAVLSALVVPVRTARRVMDRFTQALADAQQRPQSKEVVAARRDLETTEASLTAARARLAELRNQEAALDPAKRLGAFLEERVQSTQYRAQQGIIALVHRDFKMLSERMAAWRKEKRSPSPLDHTPSAGTALAGDEVNRIKPIDRIVLYIDDLDRCRPEHVVSTLEAVHLLLALDLFVVVVAVDSRWLIRALEVQYKEMLASQDDTAAGGGARGSTATDYLEKIFQLTYALPPMDPTKFAHYVEALTGTGAVSDSGLPGVSVGASVAPVPTSRPGATTPGAGSPSDAVATPPTGIPTVTAGPIAAGQAHVSSSAAPVTTPSMHGSTLRSVRHEAHVALPPVRFDLHEKEMLNALVALLTTPRMTKRLVNVYRLIKATRPGAVATEPRQKATLLLLAALFGRPAVGGRLLRGLYERRPPFDRADARLADVLAKHVEAGAGSRPVAEQAEWEILLRHVAAVGLTLTVGDCAGTPEILARYSFVTGHEWHAWSAAPAPNGADREKNIGSKPAADAAAAPVPIN
jgi:hypothetical protein